MDFPITDTQYRIMKTRLHNYILQLNKTISARQSQISMDEAIGMKNVSSQVGFLIDNYRTYSLLIQNDTKGSGLGPQLYTALNRYRRISEGHSAYLDPTSEEYKNEQAYPDIFY